MVTTDGTPLRPMSVGNSWLRPWYRSQSAFLTSRPSIEVRQTLRSGPCMNGEAG